MLIAIEPANVESEETRGLESDMVSLVRKHLAVGGKGIPYVGLMRRLDKPVTGLMLFGKTPTAVAALSKELRARETKKHYRVIVFGKPAEKAGSFTDQILQDKKANLSRIVPAGTAEAKGARLRYRVPQSKFAASKQMTEVEVELLTGRRYQVRVWFAVHGLPLISDRKCGNTIAKQGTLFRYGELCPAATGLSFTQSETRRKLSFTMEPPFEVTP